MIVIDGMNFENEYDAADWVRENASATGEYGIERVHVDGVPVDGALTDYLEYTEAFTLDDGSEILIMWTIPAKYENKDLEDWPWDNGTARVVVDGYHVEEVA